MFFFSFLCITAGEIIDIAIGPTKAIQEKAPTDSIPALPWHPTNFEGNNGTESNGHPHHEEEHEHVVAAEEHVVAADDIGTISEFGMYQCRRVLAHTLPLCRITQINADLLMIFYNTQYLWTSNFIFFSQNLL